jgi:hypothetical protein
MTYPNHSRILEEYASEVIPMILEESEKLHNSTPFQIMSSINTWELVDTELSSVRGMSEEELRNSIIADIQNVAYWGINNKKLIMMPEDLHRHVADEDQKQRIMEAFQHKDVQDLITTSSDGGLIIREDRKSEAEEYCGVYVLTPYPHNG